MGYGDTLGLARAFFSDKQRLLAGRSSGLTRGLAVLSTVMSGQVLDVADGVGRRREEKAGQGSCGIPSQPQPALYFVAVWLL